MKRVFAIMVLVFPAFAWASLDAAVATVNEVLQKVAVATAAASTQEQHNHYCALAQEYFDNEGLGKNIARKSWDKATAQDREEFMVQFPRAVAATFVKLIRGTESIEYRIGRTSENSGNYYYVAAKVTTFDPSGVADTVELAFNLKAEGQEIYVVDVQALGISMRRSLIMAYGREGYFQTTDVKNIPTLAGLNRHLDERFAKFCAL